MKLSYCDELVENYMEDDVIYWSVKGSRMNKRVTKRTFRRLERDTGIDFHRAPVGSSVVEIDIEFVDQITGDTKGLYSGMCWNKPSVGEADIQVKKSSWHWKSTAVHEIGHALGLGHDHHNRDSMMSYNRDYSSTYFSTDNISDIVDIFAT